MKRMSFCNYSFNSVYLVYPVKKIQICLASLSVVYSMKRSEISNTQESFKWLCHNQSYTIGTFHQPLIMGILNITPDSFADGGQFFKISDAIKHAREMAENGADIIDIGGESTRPGSQPVPLDEEIRRVIPVIEAVKEKTNCVVSIDT